MISCDLPDLPTVKFYFLSVSTCPHILIIDCLVWIHPGKRGQLPSVTKETIRQNGGCGQLKDTWSNTDEITIFLKHDTSK